MFFFVLAVRHAAVLACTPRTLGGVVSPAGTVFIIPSGALAIAITTMQLPPGLVALVHLLPRLLFAPTTVYISLQVYKALLGDPAPPWLRIPAYLLALPATFALNVLYTRFKDRRQAALRGAVIPPSIQYSLPGAVDKLSNLVWNFSNGYLGRTSVLAILVRHGCVDM